MVIFQKHRSWGIGIRSNLFRARYIPGRACIPIRISFNHSMKLPMCLLSLGLTVAQGRPSFRCGFVHFATCLWENNAPLRLIFIFCSLEVGTRWPLQTLQTQIPWELIRILKVLLLSFPIFFPTILYTHPHALSRSGTKNLFILSSLKRSLTKHRLWGTLSLLDLLKTTHLPTTHCLIFFVYARKSKPPPRKRELPLSSIKFTLLNLYLGVSVTLNNPIQHVIGENIMEILK